MVQFKKGSRRMVLLNKHMFVVAHGSVTQAQTHDQQHRSESVQISAQTLQMLPYGSMLVLSSCTCKAKLACIDGGSKRTTSSAN